MNAKEFLKGYWFTNPNGEVDSDYDTEIKKESNMDWYEVIELMEAYRKAVK